MDKVEKAVIDLSGNATNADFHACDLEKRILCQKENGRYLWARTGSFADRELGGYTRICTYDEFMETRKRLENKPTEWPDGMNFRVQEVSGWWHFFEHKPHLGSEATGAYIETGRRVLHAGKGRCFGDWRQSLERRPEDRSQNMNHEHQDHKEGESVKWMPEEVLISSVQGHEVEFGTGCREVSFGEGLPPVGSFVAFNKEDYFDNGYTADNWDDGDRLEVIAHRTAENGSTALILWNEKDKTADSLVKHVIRPIQSHRDKVIEAAEQHIPVRLAHKTKDLRVIFSDLYDYGMLKLPEGE